MPISDLNGSGDYKERIYMKLLSLVLLTVLLVSCSQKEEIKTEVTEKNTYKPDTSITKLVLLGTGTPNADPERSGPSVAIVVRDTPYIIDFGPGLVRRASAAHQNGIKALKVSNLKTAFLTHLHSDHTVGYPDLIFTPWVLGRDEPLKVYGPPGIKSMTENILKAYEADINVRINGLEPANTEGYKVDVTEYTEGEIYRDSNITVEAFPVNHGAWHHAFGFRFKTPDKTIVISGDCTPDSNLIKFAKGCDILIHEVYSQAGFDVRPKEWQEYHKNSHTSTIELGKIANEVQPKLLLLYHLLQWGADDEQFLGEIKENFDGKIIIGKDLEVY